MWVVVEKCTYVVWEWITGRAAVKSLPTPPYSPTQILSLLILCFEANRCVPYTEQNTIKHYQFSCSKLCSFETSSYCRTVCSVQTMMVYPVGTTGSVVGMSWSPPAVRYPPGVAGGAGGAGGGTGGGTGGGVGFGGGGRSGVTVCTVKHTQHHS